MRLLLAIKCFFLVLFAHRLPKEAAVLLPSAEKSLPETTPARDGVDRGALQLLGLLQREGRLIDFLEEDISSFGDAQIGAAVRDIHKGCKRALAEYVRVEPVLSDSDNATIRVESGFDPARIRLVGNVVGQPPFVGILKHPGWRSAALKLPALVQSDDPTVITPAEVELS